MGACRIINATKAGDYKAKAKININHIILFTHLDLNEIMAFAVKVIVFRGILLNLFGVGQGNYIHS